MPVIHPRGHKGALAVSVCLEAFKLPPTSGPVTRKKVKANGKAQHQTKAQRAARIHNQYPRTQYNSLLATTCQNPDAAPRATERGANLSLQVSCAGVRVRVAPSLPSRGARAPLYSVAARFPGWICRDPSWHPSTGPGSRRQLSSTPSDQTWRRAQQRQQRSDGWSHRGSAWGEALRMIPW